jgi:hypothetical protein
MLVAMLPIAFALALGRTGTIDFDHHQEVEILMTIGQSLLGALLLSNMRFAWWEATILFTLWLVQFMLSGFEKPLAEDVQYNALASQVSKLLSVSVTSVEDFARIGKEVIAWLYFMWSAIIVVFGIFGRGFTVFKIFPKLMREHW